MQFPIDFHLFGRTLDSHLVFEMLAFSIGFRFFLRVRRRRGDALPPLHRIWILLGATAGALVGSRVLGTLENPHLLADNWQNPLYWFASQTIVGGLLGGLAGTELTKARLGVTQSSGDLMTFPLILAMMIGRVGCFLSGIEDATHGTPTALPWGMNLGDGIPRHPAALYEIIFLGGLWVFIWQLERRHTLANGARFKVFLASYLVFRFLSEFIKPGYAIPGLGLGTIQLACLAGMAYYWRVFAQPRRLLATQPGLDAQVNTQGPENAVADNTNLAHPSCDSPKV